MDIHIVFDVIHKQVLRQRREGNPATPILVSEDTLEAIKDHMLKTTTVPPFKQGEKITFMGVELITPEEALRLEQETFRKIYAPNTASLKQEELKIVIKFEGKTTIASLIRDHEIVKSVKAYCSPCDKFKTQEGAIVAVTRLLEKAMR